MAQHLIDRRDAALMDHIGRHGPISADAALKIMGEGTKKSLFFFLTRFEQVEEFTPPGGSTPLYRLTDFGVSTIGRIRSEALHPDFTCPHCEHVESSYTARPNNQGNLVCWACRLHHLDKTNPKDGTGECRYCGPVTLVALPAGAGMACPTGRAITRLIRRGRAVPLPLLAERLRTALDLLMAHESLTPADKRALAVAYGPADHYARKSIKSA